MKFDCDRGKKRRAARRLRLQEWHPFVPVWPRKVAPSDCRLLERIERKGKWTPPRFIGCHYVSGFWLWEYRACQ